MKPFIRLGLATAVLMTTIASGVTTPETATASAESWPEQSALDRVEQYVEDYYKQNDVIGGIYGIVHQNQLIASKGFGTTRRGEDSPPSVDSLYAVASVTKTFTAAAVYQLQEEGLLDVDRPVRDFVPWFRFKQEELSNQVTLRHLLTHSAGGVGSYKTDGLLFRGNARDSTERYVQLFRHIDMAEQPGTSGNYCNGCYDLLGTVIEQVSGMSYYDYMKEKVFRPLGMSNTGFSEMIEIYDQEQIAQEYTWLFANRLHLYRNYEAFGKAQDPDGGIYSTLSDLARYAAFQLGHAEHKLNTDSVADARADGVQTESRDAFYTASGFETKELHGARIYWKLGDGSGSGSVMMLVPDYELGFILLTGEYHPELQLPIAEGAVSLLTGYEPEPVATPFTVGRIIGYAAIALTLISLLLLSLLLRSCLYARQAARPAGAVQTIAIMLAAALVALPLWYALIFIRPSGLGFYGYPYDAAFCLGMLAIAATLWVIRSIAILRRSMQTNRRAL